MDNNFETFDFEFDGGSPTEHNGIANGELVKCLLLDSGYPSAYLKALEEENKAAKQTAEDLGLDFEEKKPSFKDGGIMIKVAITERLGNQEKVFILNDKDEFVEPKYACYTQISMLPPTVIYKKQWSSFTKGLLNVKADGSLYIGNITPSAYLAQDFETKVLDEAKEAERQEAWDKLIAMYNSFTEEQALAWLLKSLAQRFLLSYRNSKGQFALLKPQIGVVFEAQVRRKEGSRLFDLQRFEWNKEKRQWDVFGKVEAFVDDESVDIATQIVGIREVNRIKREQEKAIKKVKEKVLDEVPF